MCICDNNIPFNKCCEKFLLREHVSTTPEELMRSRYSAYVRGDAAYLIETTIQENQVSNDFELIEEFSKSVTWLQLHILNTNESQVEFKAYYKDNESIKVLHEKSNFILENGILKYKDGILYNSKVQRNEPCPCGSGKKHKKCCAK